MFNNSGLRAESATPHDPAVFDTRARGDVVGSVDIAFMPSNTRDCGDPKPRADATPSPFRGCRPPATRIDARFTRDRASKIYPDAQTTRDRASKIYPDAPTTRPSVSKFYDVGKLARVQPRNSWISATLIFRPQLHSVFDMTTTKVDFDTIDMGLKEAKQALVDRLGDEVDTHPAATNEQTHSHCAFPCRYLGLLSPELVEPLAALSRCRSSARSARRIGARRP
jgi:hypothetical protein